MIQPGLVFTKMSGSGNDFIVVDNRANLLPNADLSTVTRLLSRHRLSVGADGVVLLSDPPAGDPNIAYAWRYINADGTDGEMCGNGAMCAARFAVRAGIADPHHCFLTPSGVVEAWADAMSPDAAIAVPDPGPVEPAMRIEAAGRVLECNRILVGVPHVVIRVVDADTFADAGEFHALGRAVRLHDSFAPAGTNVNVVSPIDDCTWRMRTYERGVEAETLACGTGAVASAIVLGTLGLAPNPLRIRTSGGPDLTVSWTAQEDRETDVRLGGQAAVIYDGILGADALG